MNAFERWFLKRVLAKEVVQGGHDGQIVGLYAMINEAVANEFTEDNKPTLDAYRRERFEESLQ